MLGARKAEAIVIIFLILAVIAVFIGKNTIKTSTDNIKSDDWNVSFKKKYC